MFAVAQQLVARLRDRWSTVGPAVQLLIAAFIILISALGALWLVDKLLIYLVARSYVDDVADVFDLNKHLAKAIALTVFAIAVYLIGKTFSVSRTSRRIGYLGILVLLIGHSLVLWRGTNDQKFTTSGESIKCYVITHEGEVRYGERPGSDPATGRPCRAVTPDLVYLLEEYKKGRQPQRITSTEPTFFDPRSGEPSVWYSKDKDGTVEIFDLMGFHPETREELQPITPEIVDVWKAQNKRREARPPQQVDPETFAFFDALTGKPRVWYWRGKNGEYEFYDNPGYHQRTGEQLAIITPEAIAAWKDAIKQQQQKAAEFAAAQERARQAALEKKQQKAAELAAAQERARQAALEQQQRQSTELAAEQERERQAVASCDQMAANPSDVRKPGDVAGVPYNDLKTDERRQQMLARSQ
jgi:hypothetical protein